MLNKKLSAVTTVIIINLFALANGEDGILKAASVIFRHGDRTPVEPYPTDPWKDPKFWPVGFGHLTNTGKQQHYQLGQWLRKRYDSLVSAKYNYTEMHVQSTDVDRTLMSAQANLAGFYPPTGQDVWNENLQWQPIPIHTIPEKLDDVLAAKKPCPVYDNELKKLYKSQEFKAYDKKIAPIYQYLTKHTGKTVNSLQSVQNIYSCLHIEEIFGYVLPEWTKEVYPEKLFPISGLSFAVKTYTPLLARLKSGPLLKEILTHFKNKTTKKSEPHYRVYSAHDTTVANMLNTLGVFKSLGYHNPPYTSTVMFELRKFASGDYRVQVFYKNTTEPVLLDLPGCGTSCPLDKMFEIYKEVLPANYAEECSLSLFQMPLAVNVDDSISKTTIFAFVALMMAVGFLVLFIATVYKRRDYEKWNNFNDGGWN